MRVLVGTTSGLWLAGSGEKARRLTGTCVYGVTWDGSCVYLGERDYATGGSVERLSPALGRLGAVKAQVRDVHQLLWSGGVLYWTNTHEDLLEAWAGQEVMVAYDAGGGGRDRHHLNSVWADAEGHLWVVEHGRDQDPSRVCCLNTIWAFAFPGVTDLHNVYVEGGRAYVLSAERVLSVGMAGGDVQEMVREPDSYLRGLARGDGVWAVGRSLVRRRARRWTGNAHVLLYDDGWKRAGAVTLPDAGQVHEVRLLGGDRAHNGLPYPGELP